MRRRHDDAATPSIGHGAENGLTTNINPLTALGTQLLDYSRIALRVSVSPRLRVQDYGTLPTLFPHKSKEVIEEISSIMGAWRGLRVVLH